MDCCVVCGLHRGVFKVLLILLTRFPGKHWIVPFSKHVLLFWVCSCFEFDWSICSWFLKEDTGRELHHYLSHGFNILKVDNLYQEILRSFPKYTQSEFLLSRNCSISRIHSSLRSWQTFIRRLLFAFRSLISWSLMTASSSSATSATLRSQGSFSPSL